jgi:hypothetical protein
MAVMAGHPMIARSLIRWIFQMPTPPSDLVVELEHHYMGTKTPTVNVADCVWFITEKIEPEDLESNPFIVEFTGDLRKMAEGDGTIDPLDENTWQGEDLKRLEEGIWNCIAPCSTITREEQISALCTM